MVRRRKTAKPKEQKKTKAKKTMQQTLRCQWGPVTQIFMRRKQPLFTCTLTKKEIEEDLKFIFANVPKQKRIVNSRYLRPDDTPTQDRRAEPSAHSASPKPMGATPSNPVAGLVTLETAMPAPQSPPKPAAQVEEPAVC